MKVFISFACGFLLITAPAAWSATSNPPVELQFQSADQAIAALAAATQARDTNALHGLFGPAAHEIISPDIVQATEEFDLFVQRMAKKIDPVQESDARIVLQLGDDGWPFPIPLVKRDSHWFFDTDAGKDEIFNRRIGMNEIGAIRVCRAYVTAQREFAGEDRNGDGILEYAPRLRSTPGTHDGLYWPVTEGDELSPLGPLIAQAHLEGYRRRAKIMTADQAPYHGYYFKILTRQGRHAPGGKYKYIINGHMIAGFAFVAWPAQWGNSGLMTFIVNQQGTILEKNLGPATSSVAKAMTAYDPDSTWKPARED